MISLDKVEESILELEQMDATFATCEKLALLYIVRDHLKGYEIKNPDPLDVSGSSDFIQAVNGKSPALIWPIIDEVMDTVNALHPKIYDKVMEEINDIKKTEV